MRRRKAVDMQQAGVGRAGVRTRRTAHGQFHFHQNELASQGAARIRNLQLAVLGGMLDDEPMWCRIVASLTLFDGVLLVEDIHRACAGFPEAYRLDGFCVVDWLDADGRQNRRYLSRMTAKLEPWRLPSPSQKDIEAAIDHWTAIACRCSQQPRTQLFAEIESYLVEVLPGPLFAHVTKDAPITELPRSCHARKVSKMRLQVEDMTWISGQVAHALGIAADHAFHSQRMRSGKGLVDQVVAICQQHSRRNDAADKKNMLDALLKESLRVGQTDVLSALILAFVIDLAESGGLKERNPKPQTIYKYVSNTLTGIHECLSGKDIFTLQSEAFGSIYDEIVAGTTPGNRTHCVTGLKTWHAFLVEWCDAPELEKPINPSDGPVIPNANILHDHELNMLLGWIDASGLDERLQSQLELCILLAEKIRLRAKELFTLRRRNIRRFEDGVEIEVAPRIVDGPPKTDSGRRVQSLVDPETVRRVLAWDARRESEGALSTDFLFGDPYQPEKVYQFGKMYVLINRLLKWVSGDSRISLHTLSHTWISNAIRQALLDQTGPDVPRLEVIATAAGHRSAATSITQYFHFPGEVLRYFIDRELCHLKLTSQIAQSWSGVKADALRRRASDRKRPSQIVYWEAILKNGMCLPDVGPEHGLDVEIHSTPEFHGKHLEIDLDKVVQIMLDATHEIDIKQIILRTGLSRSDVEQTLKISGLIVGRLKVKRLSDQPIKIWGSRIEMLAIDSLPKLGIVFARLKNGFWKSIMARVQTLSGDKLENLVEAWQRAFDRGYLDMSNRQCRMVFVEFVKAIGISSAHLAFAIACDDPQSPRGNELVIASDAILIFERWYGVRPMIAYMPRRRSRPDIYLVWSGVPLVPGEPPSSASTSLSGFHALMLSASVFVELSALKNTHGGHE
jgi:integrase